MAEATFNKETKQYYGLVGKVREFKKEHPDLEPSSHVTEDKLEGSVTFINCQSDIAPLQRFNIYMSDIRNTEKSTTIKSLLDADLIRRYNGGRFLTRLFLDKEGEILWEINDSSPQSGNHVAKVCSTNE